MYNIFVSNDDGINAEGIRKLVTSLSAYSKVYVSAPMYQQSAKSMGITISRSMKARRVSLAGAEMAYELDGKPVDCVKFGLQMCREEGVQIDYVITGINHGSNLGTDVLYSGTVAAATEGALSGYKAISLSNTNHMAKNFDYVCEMVPGLLKLADELEPQTILNVNVPDLPKFEIKGVKMRPLGQRGFDVVFINEKGEPEDEYRYDGFVIDYSAESDDTDITAVRDGYAVITPLTTDRTDRIALGKITEMSVGKCR